MDGEEGSTLALTGLPDWVDETYIFRLFEPTKAIVGVKLSRLHESTAGGRVAHLLVNSQQNAESIMQRYNGASPPNVDLRLNISRASEIQLRFEEYSAFVGDIAPAVTDTELHTLFHTHYPSVFEAKVVSDPTTGITKGFGFVRFASEAERDRAIQEMQGATLQGRSLRLDIAAKRNAAQPNAERSAFSHGVTAGDFDSSNTTLFVGGLAPAVTEADLQAVFQPYGLLTYVRVPLNKGCGFVQFELRAAAERALAAVHGRLLHGTPLRLSWGRSAHKGTRLHQGGGGMHPQAGADGDAACAAGQAQHLAANPRAAFANDPQQHQRAQHAPPHAQQSAQNRHLNYSEWDSAQQGYYSVPAAHEPEDVWYGLCGESAATSNPVIGYGGYTGHPEAGTTASRFGFQDPMYYDFTSANRRFSSVAPPLLAPIAMAPAHRVLRAGVAATI